MGYQKSVGNVVVSSGTVTATFTPSDKSSTVATIYGTKANQGSTTLGTVGANKRWRILGITISCASGDTGISHIDLNDIATCYTYGQYTGVVGSISSNNITFDYYACPLLTAGQTVKIVNATTGATSFGSVTYSEESV